MDKLNKKIAVLLLMVLLLTMPAPSRIWAQSRGPSRPVATPCEATARWGALMGLSAFAFGLMPGLQVVGVAYGAVAVGIKMYEVFWLNCAGK